MASAVCLRLHLRCVKAVCKLNRTVSIRPVSERHSYRRAVATYTSPRQAAQISILQSTVDKSSPSYQENEKNVDELMRRFTFLHNEAAKGGSAKAREKHIARGKMLVRE